MTWRLERKTLSGWCELIGSSPVLLVVTVYRGRAGVLGSYLILEQENIGRQVYTELTGQRIGPDRLQLCLDSINIKVGLFHHLAQALGRFHKTHNLGSADAEKRLGKAVVQYE